MSISSFIKFFRAGPGDPLFVVTFIISVGAIALALFTEYVLGYAPCHLCIYERIPYLFLGKISFSGFLVTRFERFWRICALVTLFIAIGISGYHTGVERGWFNPSETCNPETLISDTMSNDEAIAMLSKQPVATCTKAPFKVIMLSMTEWNLLLNIALFGLMWWRYKTK